ncbi:hypothetical protein ACQEVB_09975 [Pseudonocardia sp. CA-107938]|uniref:hypothetical protein n=1 Tax=Pseudonocardia sp. CA-107938 TaxID=3240021 RepID=UPI003D922FA1
MSGVSRFRLFGRVPDDPAPPPLRLAAAPRIGAPAPWGPSTALFGDAGQGREASDDPETDPQGFAAVAAEPVAPVVPFDTSPDPSPDPAESASLAGAFAADYLSWDEDDPQRRGRVLVDYLSSPGTDPTHLGWSGRGRQRAEFALPGRVRSDGDGRTLVDVRVRVTPYRRTGRPAAGTPEWAEAPDTAGIPAVAPAPQARGWEALGSYWIRLSVPVVRCGGRLAVDAWEENLGEELDEPPPVPVEEPEEPVDPSLDGDAVALPFGARR